MGSSRRLPPGVGAVGLSGESGMNYATGLSDRIETSGVKRMALCQALETHPDAAHGAIAGDSLKHVFGTGRVEAAGRGQERRNAALITTKKESHRGLHRLNKRSTSRTNSSWVASRTARRGLMTTSQSGVRVSRRTRSASRIRRRARFRTTARPKARGVVNPRRGPDCAASRSVRRQNAAKRGPEMRIPSW